MKRIKLWRRKVIPPNNETKTKYYNAEKTNRSQKTKQNQQKMNNQTKNLANKKQRGGIKALQSMRFIDPCSLYSSTGKCKPLSLLEVQFERSKCCELFASLFSHFEILF